MPDDQRPQETLLRWFGYPSFLPFQEDVIRDVLDRRDVLMIVPTGAGKSLTYQLPAILESAPTLVLSPLVALMQDQVDALQRRGIPATFINSTLDRRERDLRLQGVLRGDYRLLYVTPERFRVPEFRTVAAKIKFSRLVVDEAHCISEWGHDFRPAYSQTGEIRAFLGNPPCLALTATATPETQVDIQNVLRLQDMRIHHGGIRRPNLYLSSETIDDADAREEVLFRVLSEQLGAGIVYFTLIRDLEDMSDRLARRGLRVLSYHGRLSPLERRALQREFVSSTNAVILATNAFGLGVDKPDIRFVIHAQIPGSLEAYWQEIGRAGRDGAPAFCHLLYSPLDLAIQQNFVRWANPSPHEILRAVQILEEWGERAAAKTKEDWREVLFPKSRGDGRMETIISLLETAGIIATREDEMAPQILRAMTPEDAAGLQSPDKGKRDLMRLARLLDYVRVPDCRAQYVAEYFGKPMPDACGLCDVCAPGWRLNPHVQIESQEFQASEEDVMPIRRGEWIEIDGRWTARVVKVERAGRRFLIDVESPDDLSVRSLDLSRLRWRRLS